MGADDAAPVGCPVEEYSTAGPRRAPLAHFQRLDELRRRSRPYFRTETAQGYYVVVDHDMIVDGLRRPDLFSSSVIVPEGRSARHSQCRAAGRAGRSGLADAGAEHHL